MSFICVALLASSDQAARAEGELRFEITDSHGQLLPARVHLRDMAGQPMKSLGLTDRLDHLLVDGTWSGSVPAGTYAYAIERSPEWVPVRGEVTIESDGTKSIAATLERLVDLSKLGWYSGDLHIHRDPTQIRELIAASDLHIAPVITWWNNSNVWKGQPLPADTLQRFGDGRFARVMAGEDEREGGALLYFGMSSPIDITGSDREFPSPMTFVEQARQRSRDLHLDIEKPFWWDVPVWLALAEPDSIGLANNHMCRDRMYESEAWGKPRDTERLPAPRGNGEWTQEIYYHILNAGLRLPPSAGSASGVLPNPVGYNRVYVQVDGELTWQKWWEGLRTGRSFVTNGPLLIATVELDGSGAHREHLPGDLIELQERGPHSISLIAQIWTNDTVPRLELVHNGQVVATANCTNDGHQTLILRTDIQQPGWFLVRAITDNPRTFRFASSAPFYVEIDGEPRISRASCRFFLDWVHERMARVPDKLADPAQLETVLKYHREAVHFWEQRLAQATTE